MPATSFSIDHLLLNGFIADRNQISPSRRIALDKRVSRGKLVREQWINAARTEVFPVWRIPEFEMAERMIS